MAAAACKTSTSCLVAQPRASAPSSQPVAAILASTTLPAANTAGSALGAPLPGESDVDHIFSWLLREVIQQVINDALPPQDLGRLCNPDSLPVNNEHEHAVLVNGVLIKSVPSAASTSSTHHFTKLIPNVHCFAEAWTIYTCIQACATNDPNLGASLGAFLLHVIQTDRKHTWLLVASYAAPTTKLTPSQVGHLQSARRASRCAFGTMVEAVPRVTRAGGDMNVVVVPAATASRTAPDPVQVATPRHPTGLDGLVSLTPLSPAAPDLEPAQRPPPPQDSAWHIDGPVGPPDLSTPPLQGLARLFGNSVSMLNLGTPLLQGSSWSVVMPVGLGGTRTPPLQGLARLFNSVLAALDVPSADWCLSLLLNAWSHNPGLHPNTSFAGNVFDLALQPARHGSMQEHAFVWSTLLSLYPDPVYHHQLLGMTKHGCLLGYNGPLRNANRCSNNLPISLAGHSHLRREIDTRLAEGRLSIIPAGTNLIESPIRVVPKPRSTKLCTIHHLSHPRQLTAAALPSVNAGISPGFIRIRYKGLQDLLAFVSQNLGCLLWKGDLEDAFQHVVTAERNVHLLSFSYDGICYCENALTFGGSSSLWLFNLVAEFLHWLVAACLPTNWPVNHYLDDTFGAVPVLHTVEEPHTPSYPYTSLPWQQMPWAFGSHPKRPSAPPPSSKSWALLQRRSADLLDMQQIASLLQFVSQVFPCGKAFLRRHSLRSPQQTLPDPHTSGPMHAQRVMAAILGSTPLPLLSLPRLSLVIIARRTSAFWKLSLSLQPYDASSLIGWVPPSFWCMLTMRTLSMASAWDAPATCSPNISCGKSSASASSTTSQSGRTAVPSRTQHAILPPGTRGGPAGPPPGVTTSLGVSARATNLLWHGLATSTRCCAGGAPSSFQSFCL
ncbi:hypothetical protein NDA13_006511 [Ustilago tritici]|nr:hypothetical protein NDA13_006511 [Ustilago tritici]